MLRNGHQSARVRPSCTKGWPTSGRLRPEFAKPGQAPTTKMWGTVLADSLRGRMSDSTDCSGAARGRRRQSLWADLRKLWPRRSEWRPVWRFKRRPDSCERRGPARGSAPPWPPPRRGPCPRPPRRRPRRPGPGRWPKRAAATRPLRGWGRASRARAPSAEGHGQMPQHPLLERCPELGEARFQCSDEATGAAEAGDAAENCLTRHAYRTTLSSFSTSEVAQWHVGLITQTSGDRNLASLGRCPGACGCRPGGRNHPIARRKPPLRRKPALRPKTASRAIAWKMETSLR